MTVNLSPALADVWRDHRRWSNAASQLRKSIILWRSLALALAVLGAVLATLATQVGLDTGLGRASSLAATLALAAVPSIRAAKLGRNRIESWTRARSTSEALKAETYVYLTRTPPYDAQHRDKALLKEANRLLGQVADLGSVSEVIAIR